ncbi:MAG: MlaD family protein [Rikenellaceae bacterium]
MKKEVKIGLFTISMIVVAWAGIRFLSGTDLFSTERTYYAIYDHITGVQKSSAIYIRGVKVGRVSEISLDATHSGGVTLVLSVSSDYEIPTNSEAKIVSSNIMSPKVIELILGDSEEYLESGDTIASSQSIDLMSVAGSELESLTGQLEGVTSSLTTTLNNLNSLVVNNTDHLSSLIANLDALSRNLNSLITKNDTNITQTLEGFAELSQTLGDNSSQIDSILLNVSAITADFNEAELGSTLSQSLTEINTILAKINSNEGNIGKILGDEAIYSNLTSATSGLDSLLIDMKERPGRYIHFSVFGRDVDKQDAKAAKRAIKEANKTK